MIHDFLFIVCMLRQLYREMLQEWPHHAGLGMVSYLSINVMYLKLETSLFSVCILFVMTFFFRPELLISWDTFLCLYSPFSSISIVIFKRNNTKVVKKIAAFFYPTHFFRSLQLVKCFFNLVDLSSLNCSRKLNQPDSHRNLFQLFSSSEKN